MSFSPLHEGDTSVALTAILAGAMGIGFSPLHEGDTSVAPESRLNRPLVALFQSPSRGGHLRGGQGPSDRPGIHLRFSPLHEGDTSVAFADRLSHNVLFFVSVPFTRGTPPWRLTQNPPRRI